MPSFSKAIAFLTAFAVTSSVTMTTVDASRDLRGHVQCLPIMEGDDAVISARLFKISVPAEEYLAAVDEIFTPYYSSQAGFISYTGVATQDPDTVMFFMIYDTVENSAAAWEPVGKGEIPCSACEDPELLMNYYGTITYTGDDPGGDEDCVKGFDVGDYLSARMFYHGGNDRPQEAVAVADNMKAWTAVESFDSYTASSGLGDYDDESFFFETFNDEDDSTDANELALENTNLDPTTSLIYNVVGQVVFDSSSSVDDSGDDDYYYDDGESSEESSEDYSYDAPSEESSEESSDCESVADIIRSNPHLSYFEDLYEAATNAEGYYVDTDTWTVFAPTDEAIENSGLSADDVTAYSAIRLLLFHEVKGQALTASDLNCDAGDNLIEMGSGQATRTICRKDVPIGQKGGGNGSPALFVGDEIKGCNGIVHIIDQVLLPPSTVSWYSGLGL